MGRPRPTPRTCASQYARRHKLQPIDGQLWGRVAGDLGVNPGLVAAAAWI